MLRAVALAVAVLAGASGGAGAAGHFVFDPDPTTGATIFVTPSNNIGCIYTPAGGSTVYMPPDGGPELSCDRVEPSYLRFILGASGVAQKLTDVGDLGCCGGDNVLPYGIAWRQEPFTCKVETSGLTCTRDDGHGFFVSKAKATVY